MKANVLPLRRTIKAPSLPFWLYTSSSSWEIGHRKVLDRESKVWIFPQRGKVPTQNSKAVDKITRIGGKPKVKNRKPIHNGERKDHKSFRCQAKERPTRKNLAGQKSKGFSFRKTKNHPQLRKIKAKIHPQRWKIKTNHLPIPACFQMRLRAAIELDQKVDYLRH